MKEREPLPSPKSTRYAGCGCASRTCSLLAGVPTRPYRAASPGTKRPLCARFPSDRPRTRFAWGPLPGGSRLDLRTLVLRSRLLLGEGNGSRALRCPQGALPLDPVGRAPLDRETEAPFSRYGEIKSLTPVKDCADCEIVALCWSDLVSHPAQRATVNPARGFPRPSGRVTVSAPRETRSSSSAIGRLPQTKRL
jgi:hypothetical protein